MRSSLMCPLAACLPTPAALSGQPCSQGAQLGLCIRPWSHAIILLKQQLHCGKDVGCAGHALLWSSMLASDAAVALGQLRLPWSQDSTVLLAEYAGLRTQQVCKSLVRGYT